MFTHLVFPHEKQDILHTHKAAASHDSHIRCMTKLHKIVNQSLKSDYKEHQL